MGCHGNDNSLLKKQKPMGTGTHRNNYENMLKWVFGCTVGLIMGNLIFLSKFVDIMPFSLFINYQ